MRIAEVTVRNFRSLKDVTIKVDDYGVLIGANGSGKSSVLYALDWFFNGTPIAASDLYGYHEGDSLDHDPTIEVVVTFTGLTDKDRERLEQYGRGDQAVVRRTWYAASSQVKTVGNSKQGAGFAKVRSRSCLTWVVTQVKTTFLLPWPPGKRNPRTQKSSSTSRMLTPAR